MDVSASSDKGVINPPPILILTSVRNARHRIAKAFNHSRLHPIKTGEITFFLQFPLPVVSPQRTSSNNNESTINWNSSELLTISGHKCKRSQHTILEKPYICNFTVDPRIILTQGY